MKKTLLFLFLVPMLGAFFACQDMAPIPDGAIVTVDASAPPADKTIEALADAGRFGLQPIVWSGDIANGVSGNSAQYVSSLTPLGAGGVGGNLTVNANELIFAPTSNAIITQGSIPGTGSTNGTALELAAQGGQTQSGVVANTNGGAFALLTGPAGTGGSGAAGLPGAFAVLLGGATVVTQIQGISSDYIALGPSQRAKVATDASGNMVLGNTSFGVYLSGVNSAFGYGLSNVVNDGVRSLQTTNATPTTIFSFSASDNTVYSVTAKCMGRNSSNNGDAFYAEYQETIQRFGGAAASLVGSGASALNKVTNGGGSSYAVTFSRPSSVETIQVTGVAATTINWSCQVEYMQVQ